MKQRIDYPKNQLVIVAGLILLAFIFESYQLIYAVAVLGIIFLSLPRLGNLIVDGWIIFGKKLGWFNSIIILSVIYLMILTPIALLRRINKLDHLRLLNPKGKSLWTDRNHLYASEDLNKMW